MERSTLAKMRGSHRSAFDVALDGVLTCYLTISEEITLHRRHSLLKGKLIRVDVMFGDHDTNCLRLKPGD